MLALSLLAVRSAGALPHGGPGPVLHQPDGSLLRDPLRPVSEVGQTHFTLQYFTLSACETRVELREGTAPRAIRGAAPLEETRVANGPPGRRHRHQFTVDGLRPGRRYYYRIFDPGLRVEESARAWGETGGWRREQAVSTLAPAGEKSIIRLPVRVLWMPNVLNLESAYRGRTGGPAPPEPLSSADLELLQKEYSHVARFLWVNSGMRLWVDFQILVDARLQRWGPEPPGTLPTLRGLPVCRNYSGVEFRGPGGGEFTLVDPRQPGQPRTEPDPASPPVPCQIEQAFLRRWNARSRGWEFTPSGAGTLGAERLPEGFPARSQFLGGSDTAWLVAHEFHHQLESLGALSLTDREEDRVVFNHHGPRRRLRRPDGTEDRQDWSTSGRHGAHWDGMAFWDRTLTDVQWLRWLFGETVTVKDADQDGVPDDDPRLPLDERRFGSDPTRPRTDGRLGDLDKAMLSTWAPRPLQPTWSRAPFQARTPKPQNPDSDGDGLPDGDDPAPLEPAPPFVWPVAVQVDGQPGEWGAAAPAAEVRGAETQVHYHHAWDMFGYSGLLQIAGPWKRVTLTLDGEGAGYYSGVGVQVLELVREERSGEVRMAPLEVPFQPARAPGLVWKGGRARKSREQGPEPDSVEFRLPNGGEGLWHWEKAGREVGVAVEVELPDGRVFSGYEPYRLFYCRMVGR